jgi:tartrate-resistant acid phosphatase type 5
VTDRRGPRRGLILVIVIAGLVAVAIANLAARYSMLPSARGALAVVAPDKERLHLFVLGDVGADTPAQHAVARAMEARCNADGADGIVLVGDNVYDTRTDPAPWRTLVEKTYDSPCLGRLPIYAMLGNHDYKFDPQAEVDYGINNPRWHLPNRFYKVQFGALLELVVYDTWLPDLCGSVTHCSLDFLRESLAKPEARWMVVASHYPLQSPSARGWTRRGGLRGWLARKFVCGHADAYLAGHNHYLEYSRDPDCGVDSIVAGGGGARLRQLDPGRQGVYFASAAHGFVELTATPERLEYRFFDSKGNALYEHATEHAAH